MPSPDGPPTISVALCTHRGARFVAEQVESILAQTVAVTEIVVGDDASDDDTVAIVRATVGDRVPLVVREHRPALGVAGNFADAIAATTGDVVALSDQDDVWHPDRLERLLPALAGHDLAHSDAALVDAAGRPLGTLLSEAHRLTQRERTLLAEGRAFDALLRRNLVTGATTILDGAFARAAPPIGAGWIHDEWLAMLAAMGRGVAFVDEPLVDYRQHDANVIGARRVSRAERAAAMLRPDAGLHVARARRATALERATTTLGLGSPEQRSAIAARAAHERLRATLPPARIARIPAVVRAAARGDYARHATGARSVVRDLVEPRDGISPALD